MQPEQKTTAVLRRIAAKEITLFFASPVAYLFLGAFVAISLFIVFWVETFFARNIADIRPLFTWMPVLLIFLASTLTMRMWSEERRSGTLEYILTQPVPLWQFVVGKFLGCLALLAIALLITVPLPITISLIGHLDWGPVLAGYIATFLLGATYLSIGLFVSSRTDNQIVSLIIAVAVCAVFYLIGTPVITDLFGNQTGMLLRLFGTGSRFSSITRGVLDLRDLYYYVSLIAIFLALNTYLLEKDRWADNPQTSSHHRRWQVVSGLFIVNALVANLWLGQIHVLRIDTTAGQRYSLSNTTRHYLGELQEPLLLRGYFSSKTHPLLAPLVPQLEDLMQEYQVAGNGKVKVEIIDPTKHPKLEQEANQKYDIHPVPFQVSSRYQSSVVNSYFNILVQYGDQYQVLTFNDLIELQARSESNIDVELRNPEYDLTRTIKKVINSYQSSGNLFDTVKGNLDFHFYASADSKLPNKLVQYRKDIDSVLSDMKKQAGSRLTVSHSDPDANDGKLAQRLTKEYGFEPMTTNLLSQNDFWFYMTLSKEDQIVQLPLGDMSKASFKRNLSAAIKRFAHGFTKTVALVTPPRSPYARYNLGGPQFSKLADFLGKDLNVEHEDLSDGSVSGNADILLLAAPKQLDKKALFAVDQFLMKGGTVIALTSPYSATFANRTLGLNKVDSGLEKWLAHNGVTIGKQLVMDPKNTQFPVPVARNVGGYSVQEIHMLDYPYFPDIRGKGLNGDNPITSDLPQATMMWASPITVKADPRRKTTALLHSSKDSWLTSSTEVMPHIGRTGMSSYKPEGKQGSQLLGVIDSGVFDSYFADSPSPLLNNKQPDNGKTGDTKTTPIKDKTTPNTVVSSVLKHSPASARLIVFSANDFARDQMLKLAGSATRGDYLNTLQMVTNAVDWALDDDGLLSIRSRSHFNQTLPPMSQRTEMFWEYLNYALATLALALVVLLQRQRKVRKQRAYVRLLAE